MRLAALLLCLAATGCGPERRPVELVVDVWMNGPIEKLTGKPWPNGRTGKPLTEA